jgi:hypothetical protein
MEASTKEKEVLTKKMEYVLRLDHIESQALLYLVACCIVIVVPVILVGRSEGALLLFVPAALYIQHICIFGYLKQQLFVYLAFDDFQKRVSE